MSSKAVFRWRFLTLGIAASVMATWLLIGTTDFKAEKDSGGPSSPDVPAKPTPPPDKRIEPNLTEDLAGAGWPRAAANAVITLNTRWIDHLSKNAPEELTRQRIILQKLGQYPQVFDLLEHRPELAGLLVSLARSGAGNSGHPLCC